MTRLEHIRTTVAWRSRPLVDALPVRPAPLALVVIALIVAACKGGGNGY